MSIFSSKKPEPATIEQIGENYKRLLSQTASGQDKLLTSEFGPAIALATALQDVGEARLEYYALESFREPALQAISSAVQKLNQLQELNPKKPTEQSGGLNAVEIANLKIDNLIAGLKKAQSEIKRVTTTVMDVNSQKAAMIDIWHSLKNHRKPIIEKGDSWVTAIRKFFRFATVQVGLSSQAREDSQLDAAGESLSGRNTPVKIMGNSFMAMQRMFAAYNAENSKAMELELRALHAVNLGERCTSIGVRGQSLNDKVKALLSDEQSSVSIPLSFDAGSGYHAVTLIAKKDEQDEVHWGVVDTNSNIIIKLTKDAMDKINNEENTWFSVQGQIKEDMGTMYQQHKNPGLIESFLRRRFDTNVLSKFWVTRQKVGRCTASTFEESNKIIGLASIPSSDRKVYERELASLDSQMQTQLNKAIDNIAVIHAKEQAEIYRIEQSSIWGCFSALMKGDMKSVRENASGLLTKMYGVEVKSLPQTDIEALKALSNLAASKKADIPPSPPSSDQLQEYIVVEAMRILQNNPVTYPDSKDRPKDRPVDSPVKTCTEVVKDIIRKDKVVGLSEDTRSDIYKQVSDQVIELRGARLAINTVIAQLDQKDRGLDKSAYDCYRVRLLACMSDPAYTAADLKAVVEHAKSVQQKCRNKKPDNTSKILQAAVNNMPQPRVGFEMPHEGSSARARKSKKTARKSKSVVDFVGTGPRRG